MFLTAAPCVTKTVSLFLDTFGKTNIDKVHIKWI
jgi:hypothetical protein